MGILIPSDTSLLVLLNFDKLITGTSLDLYWWMLLNTLLWGKVNTLKMNIVPHIICKESFHIFPENILISFIFCSGNFCGVLQHLRFYWNRCNCHLGRVDLAYLICRHIIKHTYLFVIIWIVCWINHLRLFCKGILLPHCGNGLL